MKHIGKIATLIIALIMAAAIAIGIGVIFSVRNVNVTLLSYSVGEEEINSEISSLKNGVMDKCRGRVMSFVSEEDVISCLDDGYTLESFEKVFPCTINVTVKQRREVFAVLVDERYTMYDENAKVMRIADDNVNTVDNSPNVVVEGTENEDDLKNVAAVCAIFQSPANFGALRSAVEKIVLYKSKTNISLDKDKITFVLRSGLSIEINDYPQNTSEKIARAYKEFDRLSPEERLKGIIYTFSYPSGELGAEYNKNG